MTMASRSGLPSGVSVLPNRPGLYMFRVMIKGQPFTEYHRSNETGKKKLQSELQRAYDAFKERAENGMLSSGDITDNSKFAQAVEWFIGIRKLELRESTQRVDQFTFEHYLVPRLGNYKLKEITSPMITRLLAELLEKGGGGGRAVYAAKPEFIAIMHDKKPARSSGGFNKVARELGIGVDNTFIRVRNGANCDKETADKVAKYYGVPLSAAYVSKITYTLSALFTACVKNGILLQNPVTNATKPRIGERDVPAYLNNTQALIFLEALYRLDIDNPVRVALTLMLALGLRTGEARGLRWLDVDFNGNIISIEKNCGDTMSGLALTELKSKRSRRKIALSPMLYGTLTAHKDQQAEYARSLGSLWQDNGLVCPNTTGGFMGKAAPNNAIKRIIAARPELPQGLHAHSLRHSFVSLLISQGYDPVTVARLAGDTIEVISKHYAHSFAERRAAAMEDIGALFAGLGNNLLRLT